MVEGGHAASAAAWLERLPRDLSSEQLARSFERAFDALQRRAAMTLGEVTLTAIIDRVLHDARARFPVLASLTLEGYQLQWGALHALATGLDGDTLREAARSVLVEFMTVLGSLTAEILTPALHTALMGVAGEDERGPPDGRAAPGSNDDEGAAR